MKKLALATLIFLLAPAVCLAQAAKKIPVAVGHTGPDQVGQSFAFALKEAIRGSQSFFLVDYETLHKNPRIVVHVVSIDDNPATEAVSSAIGITIVYNSLQTPGNGTYLSSAVFSCGHSRVQSCARNTLPLIDRAVEFLQKIEPSLWKTL